MTNPRYPHFVTVFREEIDTSSIEQNPEKIILHSGECNSHSTTGGRYTRGDVNMSNFLINLPRHSARIMAGDLVEVQLPERVVKGVVVDSIISNMSAYIFYNEFKQ